MLRIKLLVLCACLHFISIAQTIGGVVNTYHKVTDLTNDNKETSVLVDDVTGLNVLDKVMIIQMKGAVIDSSNNNNFGKVSNTNIKNAGNYEVATICRLEGNRVFFVYALLQAYDISGKVQLVKIPKYANAVVTEQLEPAPWDNSTGKGGVLAISVANTLTLNANITADGKGFKGGDFKQSSGDCNWASPANDFYYNANILSPQNGAFKGESVYQSSTSLSGGKGAIANGGGGGNNHNNGGGGGANLTDGGKGGGNSSSGIFTCNDPNPGLGGYGLTNNNGKKIFVGGGGGAGHVNNALLAHIGGGNGGGIVFIEAAVINNNGYKISANGIKGGNTMGDGASGGGGGGSIIMSVKTYSNPISIEAKGGEGGQVDNESISGHCYGEGGGGGGGAIYFENNMPVGSIIVSGGSKGLRINTIGCGSSNPGSNGNSGTTKTLYSYPQSITISKSCPESTVLPVGLISFEAFIKEKKTALQWQITEPKDAKLFIIQRKGGNSDWKDMTTLQAQSGVNTYTATDATITEGNYQYRLKIIEQDGSVVYSPIRSVSLAASRSGQFVIYPNPAKNEITILKNWGAAANLEIFDATGKLVYQKRLGNSSVVHQDITFLQKGLYIIKVDGVAQRLIVSH